MDAVAGEVRAAAGAALDFACRAAGRDFSRQEWRESIGDIPYVDPCPSD